MQPMPMNSLIFRAASLWALTLTPLGLGQDNVPPIYDEDQVPTFTLPNPLVSIAGEQITSAETWQQQRRPELLQLFRDEMYGGVPDGTVEVRYQVFEQSDDALDGMAIRKQITAFFTNDDEGPRMDILLYLPRDAVGPVPTFVGLNFNGNHSISHDPNVPISTRWMLLFAA